MAAIQPTERHQPQQQILSTESILTLVGIVTMLLIPILCALFKIFVLPRSKQWQFGISPRETLAKSTSPTIPTYELTNHTMQCSIPAEYRRRLIDPTRVQRLE
jgi:hypothetical protein